MTINDIRSKYLAYMQKHGHEVIPSSSLIPQNDPTTLFTGSGMQQLMPYLLGQSHPKGARLTDSQKCFRAEDIEEIGDNRHTTFFEMLGNWALGDYFKKEQLPFFFGFLVDELGIDPSKLYVTVFAGDETNNIARDDESVQIWKELFASKGIEATDVVMGSEEDGARLGMRGGRIFYYDVKKNWWSRAGIPSKMPAGEPGGPDSEMFYDFSTPHDAKFGAECHPNCDCGRFMEIGNSVFMQYLKTQNGFELLPKQNVDFGGGLERIAAAAAGTPDVFVAVDVLANIIALIAHFSGKSYDDSRYTRSFRIIADHMRAATFMLAAGIIPSNTERGYVLRRLIRRAALHAQKLEVADKDAGDSMLHRAAILIIEYYKHAYPELEGEEVFTFITTELHKEEMQFARTLADGTKEFQKAAATGAITGEQAFTLFTTHGFPFELTQEMAHERGLTVDAEDFAARMKAHQDLSRSGSEQKFKGGLADASEETTRLHTAHHLLLRALQIVLGDQVKQRGSNITKERLRIDFSYGAKMTPEEIKKVEDIVNEQIQAALPMTRWQVSKEEAEATGAEHEFGAKYPDTVSVYMVGNVVPDDFAASAAQSFSKEFCGGPHVQNTNELKGTFKILKEEASSAGVRRIKAVLQ
ncbi:MAG: Alanine--tRNA ligase [Candidatus Parcubacteria bacterium]|jgi:alanyl-tRNA synthetase